MGRILYNFKDYEVKKYEGGIFVDHIGGDEETISFRRASVFCKMFDQLGVEFPVFDSMECEKYDNPIEPKEMTRFCDILLSDIPKYIEPFSTKEDGFTVEDLVDDIKYLKEKSNAGFYFALESM